MDKRKYHRLDTALNVAFSFADGGGGGKWYHGITCNISHGGLCIEVGGDLEELTSHIKLERESLLLKLQLSDPEETVDLRGSLVRGTSRIDLVEEITAEGNLLQLGVVFDERDDEIEDRIRREVIDRFLKKYGISAGDNHT